MVENLSEMMQREWSLGNQDANDHNSNPTMNHTWHSRSLTRKISDQPGSNNHHHHQLASDYNDVPVVTTQRNSNLLRSRISSDTAYDTDGAVEPSRRSLQHHPHTHHSSSNNYEHLISPRLPVRRPTPQSSKQTTTCVPNQHRSSHKLQRNVSSPLGATADQDERDEDSNYDSDVHRRHIRLSRRAHHPSTFTGNHAPRISRSSALTQHGGPLTSSYSAQPLRIVFMRHSERANQALGPDWFSKAFRTNTYVPYDQNLPLILPKRRFDQAYVFDAPLTVRGLKMARLTGRTMLSHGLIPDVCLSSSALRCVQTCERILTGMDRRDRIPIRVEPGLFECPHLNQKITDSFMSKRELMENRYNIKHEYKALIPKISVPETLDDYFDRSVAVMRGIIDRYGRQGGTVLIVTHAPGILALTDAVKGLRPNMETFYRTVSNYPPLATYIAEYDGSKWRFSDQPFNFVSSGQ